LMGPCPEKDRAEHAGTIYVSERLGR